ncbi:MAG: 30S ribosomal protein S6 [Patescibacteria group bacterium]
MAQRKYQLTVVFQPGLAAEEVKKGQKVLKETVERLEGKVESQDSLGIKTLAYPVAGAMQASFERLNIFLPAENAAALRSELEKSNLFVRVLLEQGGK